MIRFLSILLLAMGVGAAELLNVPPQYNFVFVVDTSHSMAPYKVLSANLVRWAIHSGFGGQIQKGDSIDIWTYDDENHITRYPPQIWGTQESEQLALAAGRFVEGLKFRGRSKFPPVAADLNSLLPHTKGCLVMILTDGDEPFSDLSIDIELNDYIAREKKEYSGARQPYMISFAAVNGKINQWTVHHGNESLQMAGLPTRPEPAPVMAAAEIKARPVAPASASSPNVVHNQNQSSRPKTPPRTKPRPTAEPPPPVIFDLPPGSRLANVTPAAEPEEELNVLTALPSATELPLSARTSDPALTPQPAAEVGTKAPTNAEAAPKIVAKSPTIETPRAAGTPTVAQTAPASSAAASPSSQRANPSTNVASIAKPVKTAAPETNIAAASVRSNSPAATLATDSKTTNSIAGTTKGPNIPPPGGMGPEHASSGLGIPSIPPVAIYLALLAGLTSVGLAIFVLLRRSKARHTGSIISRSLQQ